MRYIEVSDIKDDSILQRRDYINNVTFLDSDTCNIVIEACNSDLNILKLWFNKINIEYTDIFIVHNKIYYTIDDMTLCLSDLSSGERYALYLIACKQLHKDLIAASVFERLGRRLEAVVTSIVKDYDELTIIVYNAILPKELHQYRVKELL